MEIFFVALGARHLAHFLGSGDVAQSFGNEGGVSMGFFHASLKVSGHFFSCAQMVSDIVRGGEGLSHFCFSGFFILLVFEEVCPVGYDLSR